MVRMSERLVLVVEYNNTQNGSTIVPPFECATDPSLWRWVGYNLTEAVAKFRSGSSSGARLDVMDSSSWGEKDDDDV